MKVCCCWRAEGKISREPNLKSSSSSAKTTRLSTVLLRSIGGLEVDLGFGGKVRG